MTLERMIAKLRRDIQDMSTTLKVLETFTQTPETAAKLVAHVHKQAARKAKSGKSYAPGTHWTQKPENKARLRALRAKQRR